MTSKAEFNAEEWEQVVEGPALAGLIVIAAQRGGTIRETMKMAKAYTQAREEHGDSDLLGEIVSTPPKLQSKKFESAEALRNEGLERVREAAALVGSKADAGELDTYKRFIITVAEKAAEATKSGDFLGIGGELVSEKESEVLDAIAETLGVPRSA